MEYVEGETLAGILARLKEDGGEVETPLGRTGEPRYFVDLARGTPASRSGPREGADREARQPR